MLEWLFHKKIDLEPDKVDIEDIWRSHTSLSIVVRQMSEVMRAHAEATKKIREDLEFLAQHVIRISDEQNKLRAQILRDEDLLSKDFSSRIH